MNNPDGGTKYDADKVRLDLLEPTWLDGVARVLTFGAKKYAAWNWSKGLAYSRLIRALLGHIFAFMGGEEIDPESGLPHLDHAGCCLMFLRTMSRFRKDLDDRGPNWADIKFKEALEAARKDIAPDHSPG